MSRKTFVFDLDGVIAAPVEKHTQYSECEAFLKTLYILDQLRELGHKIVIHTARWKEDEPVTVAWLAALEVPYDELIFEKPLGDVYVDDRAFKYSGGTEEDTSEQLEKLLEASNG